MSRYILGYAILKCIDMIELVTLFSVSVNIIRNIINSLLNTMYCTGCIQYMLQF